MMEASTIESTTSSIKCEGSYACYQANEIQTTVSSSLHLFRCSGLLSCANVNTLSNIYGWDQCIGTLSCYNSSIYVSNYYLSCDGLRSCANSYIETNANNKYIRGI